MPKRAKKIIKKAIRRAKKIGSFLLDNSGTIGLILFAITIISLCLYAGIQERKQTEQQQVAIVEK